MTSIAGTSSADTRIFNAGRQARQDAGDPVNPTGNTSRTGATDTRTEKSAQTSLSVGDRGPEVQQVQQALDDAGYSPGPIDGIFGLRTHDRTDSQLTGRDGARSCRRGDRSSACQC